MPLSSPPEPIAMQDPTDRDPLVHPDHANNPMVALAIMASNGIKSFLDWIRESGQRQQWAYGLAGAIAVLLMVGLVGLPNGKGPIKEPDTDPKPPPVASDDVRFFTYTVQDGDARSTIAEDFGTTEEQILADNHDVFVDNAKWCRARVIKGKPISEAYLKGLMPNGITQRDGVFCKLEVDKKGNLVDFAPETLRPKHNKLRIRCSAATQHISSCNPDPIAAR